MAKVVDSIVRDAVTTTSGDITYGQYHYLEALASAGPCSVARLAAALGVQPSSTSRSVRRLVGTELVVVQPNLADGRARLLACTEEGSRLVQAVQTRTRQELRRLVVAIPAATATPLVRGLGHFVAAAEVAVPEGRQDSWPR